MSLWKLFQSSMPSAGRRQYNLITSSISQTPARKTRSRLKQINCERTRVYIISAHRRITEVVLSQSPGVCSACKLWCSPKKACFFFFCFALCVFFSPLPRNYQRFGTYIYTFRFKIGGSDCIPGCDQQTTAFLVFDGLQPVWPLTPET